MSAESAGKAQDGPIQGCADFLALLASYRAGELPPARVLLLEDHLRECVACRKAVGRSPAPPPARRAARRRRPLIWALAAGGVVVAVGAAWLLLRPSSGRVTVETVNGALYQVSPSQMARVAPGAEVAAGGEVRTAKDSGAFIRLGDGSSLEVRERSSFNVAESADGITVYLNRGAVIVEAARRRFGTLYVATRDCRVAAAGTVFGVNAGVKGSRVVVLEGEVRVTRGDEQKTLKAGEQYATDPSMTPVAIRDEIAWSKDPARRLALLKEPAAAEKTPAAARLPGLRYSNPLLALLPADTAVVISLPNLDQAVSEVRRLLAAQTASNRALGELLPGGKNKEELAAFLDRLGALSGYLGREIVVGIPAGASGARGAPILLAEVRKPGFEAALRETLAKSGAGRDVRVTLRGNVAMLSAAPPAAHGGEGGFASTPLFARLNDAYRDGAGTLVAVDAARLAPGKDAAPGRVQQLVLEQRAVAGKTDTHATVYFDSAQSGPPSWLAPPASIGALDFVSPEATLAAAFALKSPVRALDELAAYSPKVPPQIRELAGALGGEFVFAFDGAGFPLLTWKLAAEVYDPEKFEQTVQRIVAEANQDAAKQGGPEIKLRQEAAGGRTYHLLSFPAASQFGEAAYIYIDGYVVAAANRGLLDRALQYRASGYTLARSTDFAQLAPRDRYTGFSGVLYQNMGPTLGPLAEIFAAGAQIKAEQKDQIRKFASDLKPALVTLYAAGDHVTIASSSDFFTLDPARLAGLSGPLAMVEMLRGKAGTSR